MARRYAPADVMGACVVTVCQGAGLPVGPEGLEPSPRWLRARYAAANTWIPWGHERAYPYKRKRPGSPDTWPAKKAQTGQSVRVFGDSQRASRPDYGPEPMRASVRSKSSHDGSPSQSLLRSLQAGISVRHLPRIHLKEAVTQAEVRAAKQIIEEGQVANNLTCRTICRCDRLTFDRF